MRLDLKLNGNDVTVDWTGNQLVVLVGDQNNPLDSPHVFSEDDIHNILRAINQVRRERWRAEN